jgi:hypothetical protein
MLRAYGELFSIFVKLDEKITGVYDSVNSQLGSRAVSSFANNVDVKPYEPAM